MIRQYFHSSKCISNGIDITWDSKVSYNVFKIIRVHSDNRPFVTCTCNAALQEPILVIKASCSTNHRREDTFGRRPMGDQRALVFCPITKRLDKLLTNERRRMFWVLAGLRAGLANRGQLISWMLISGTVPLSAPPPLPPPGSAYQGLLTYTTYTDFPPTKKTAKQLFKLTQEISTKGDLKGHAVSHWLRVNYICIGSHRYFIYL